MKPRHGKAWKPRLARLAQRDYANIINWTEEKFGLRQSDAYAALIDKTLDHLAADPIASPSQNRDADLGEGYRTFHMPQKGRHILVYRIEAERVLIVRILHDSMDLARHLPSGDD